MWRFSPGPATVRTVWKRSWKTKRCLNCAMRRKEYWPQRTSHSAIVRLECGVFFQKRISHPGSGRLFPARPALLSGAGADGTGGSSRRALNACRSARRPASAARPCSSDRTRCPRSAQRSGSENKDAQPASCSRMHILRNF